MGEVQTRILLTGAGGPASIGVARSLKRHYLIGTDANPYSLHFAETDVKYVTPKASEPTYVQSLMDICARERIEFVHAQPDTEVEKISEFRDVLPTTFLPPHETVRRCQDKLATWRAWSKAEVPVPHTLLISEYQDLVHAFSELERTFWIRLRSGAAGAGSLKVSDLDEARTWITRHRGWGDFIASEFLPGGCFTYQTLWYKGEMIVGQVRERLDWAMGNRAPSGVTGVTGVARTSNDPRVAAIARDAVLAVDKEPHGIFGVDMKCDSAGVPNPTEINIGRFFTTIEFFTRLGLNFPEIYVNLGMSGGEPKVRPATLCEGFYWIRSMDSAPKLVAEQNLHRHLAMAKAA